VEQWRRGLVGTRQVRLRVDVRVSVHVLVRAYGQGACTRARVCRCACAGGCACACLRYVHVHPCVIHVHGHMHVHVHAHVHGHMHVHLHVQGRCKSIGMHARVCRRVRMHVHVHVRVDRPLRDAGPARRPRRQGTPLAAAGHGVPLQLPARQARVRRCSRRGRRGGGFARGSEITTHYSLLITYYSYTTYYSLLATRYVLLLLLTTHDSLNGLLPPACESVITYDLLTTDY